MFVVNMGAQPTKPAANSGTLQWNNGGKFAGTTAGTGSNISWNGDNAFSIIDGVNGGHDSLYVNLGTGQNSTLVTIGGAGAFNGSRIDCPGPSLEISSAGPLFFAREAGLPFAEFDQNGNFQITKTGNGFGVREGGDCKQGVGTLVAGTVVIANASITAVSRIFLTAQTIAGVAGALGVSARVVGTSFTVTSTSAADVSTFAYEIFEPA
jgi:hypothetical protein